MHAPAPVGTPLGAREALPRPGALPQEAAREQHEALRTRSAQGAGDESESEEDVPLAEKRRRLGKAVVGDDSEEDEPLAVKRQRLEKAAKARQPGKERPKLAAAAPPSTAAAAAAAGAEAEVQPSGSAADAARVGRAEGGKEAQRAAAAAAAPPSAPGSTDELDAQRLRAMLGRLVPVPNSLARQERRRRLLREAEVGGAAATAGATALHCAAALPRLGGRPLQPCDSPSSPAPLPGPHRTTRATPRTLCGTPRAAPSPTTLP